MNKTVIEYANPNNGGMERVVKSGNEYFINSDFRGKGFERKDIKVSRAELEMCLKHTNAPASVVAEILSA